MDISTSFLVGVPGIHGATTSILAPHTSISPSITHAEERKEEHSRLPGLGSEISLLTGTSLYWCLMNNKAWNRRDNCKTTRGCMLDEDFNRLSFLLKMTEFSKGGKEKGRETAEPSYLSSKDPNACELPPAFPWDRKWCQRACESCSRQTSDLT